MSVTNSRDLFAYYQDIKSSRIILVFKGAFTQEMLSELGGLVRLHFHEEGETIMMRRLFSILIEMSQNILHYSAEREFLTYLGREVGVGMITVQDIDGYFMVNSGNMVTKSTGERLDEKCTQINALGREELRQLYMDTRRKEAEPTSKGAGLGLIDIARKSSRPLSFVVQKIDEEKSFFSLSVAVDKKPKTEGAE
jgi:hypothetical protein